MLQNWSGVRNFRFRDFSFDAILKCFRVKIWVVCVQTASIDQTTNAARKIVENGRGVLPAVSPDHDLFAPKIDGSRQNCTIAQIGQDRRVGAREERFAPLHISADRARSPLWRQRRRLRTVCGYVAFPIRGGRRCRKARQKDLRAPGWTGCRK